MRQRPLRQADERQSPLTTGLGPALPAEVLNAMKRQWGILAQLRFVSRCCAAFLAISGTSTVASAQSGRSQPKSMAPHIPAPGTETEAAVDASIVYTFDVWHNARGGIARGRATSTILI